MTSNASSRRVCSLVLCGLAAALAITGTNGTALAQEQTVVIGGAGGDDVQVNLSVLDSYGGGSPQTRRHLLFPGSTFKPGQRIILRRPGTAPKRTTSRQTRRRPALPSTRRARATQSAPPKPRVRTARRSRTGTPPRSLATRGKTARTKRETTATAPAQARPAPMSRATANLKAPPLAPPPPAINTKPMAAPSRREVPPAPAPVKTAPPPAPPVAAAPRTPVTAAPLVKTPPPPRKATGGRGEVASIPRIGPVVSGSKLRILFAPGSARLDSDGRDLLRRVSAALAKNAKLRVELKAYARGNTGSVSQARRLSLSRALAIRSQLIKNGVRATRIDVRALGSKVPDGVPNRADLLVFTR